MSTVRITTLPVLLALAAGAPAAAQADDLVPAEQMVEDIPSIAVSFRQIEQGLGQPSDFSRVYRAPGDQFMRIQGAVYAVYPTSEYGYNKKKKVTYPVVPAGTVFYIGEPPVAETPPPRRPVADPEPEVITMRVVTTPVERRRLPSHEKVQLQIIADDDYRAARLHSLLSRAAAAGVTPPADDPRRRQRTPDSPVREPDPPSDG